MEVKHQMNKYTHSSANNQNLGVVYHRIECFSAALDFQPDTIHPAELPALAWDNLLLNGFDRTEGSVWNLRSHNPNCGLAEAIKLAHPNLSLAEMARLFGRRAVVSDLHEEFPRLCALVGWRYGQELVQCLDLLQTTSLNFQKWVSAKKVQPSEVRILSENLSAMDSKTVLAQFELGQWSRRDGVQAIQWLAELQLQGVDLANELATFWPDSDKVLRRLQHLRHPITSQRDQDAQRKVREWPWPSNTQAKWVRTGDRAHIEVSLQAVSHKEFGEKLNRLLEISEKMTVSDKNPWVPWKT